MIKKLINDKIIGYFEMVCTKKKKKKKKKKKEIKTILKKNKNEVKKRN